MIVARPSRPCSCPPSFLLAASRGLRGGDPQDQAEPAYAATASRPIIFGVAADEPDPGRWRPRRCRAGTSKGIRDYKPWDGDAVRVSSPTWMRDTGHTLFLSIKAQRANGATHHVRRRSRRPPSGSQLYQEMLRHQAAADQGVPGRRCTSSFNHEPEASGTTRRTAPARSIAAAFRKFVTVHARLRRHQREVRRDVHRVRLHRARTRSAVNNYYPGDAYVDGIGGRRLQLGRRATIQPWTLLMASLVDRPQGLRQRALHQAA